MSYIKNRCSICEEGVLTAHNGFEDQEYRGQAGKISFEYSDCDACGSEQASTAQARANKRATIVFEKVVDGTLLNTTNRFIENSNTAGMVEFMSSIPQPSWAR